MSYYPDIPDDPIIRKMEMYGTLCEEEEREPVCPICGNECETMYTDLNGEVLGCDCCVKSDEPDARFFPEE